ncbi:MAG: signal peptide peptidase SppA [Bacteroidales bacterium]|jgi:protease-4|nr:signal peptide peptidase SppA [Bacteroidales bacterium]
MKNFFSSMLGSLAALFIYSFLSIILGIAFIVAMAAGASKTKTVEVKNNTILELRLQGQIVERISEEDEIFANLSFPGQDDNISIQGLNRILAAIKNAENDAKIEGIYIRSDMFSAGSSTAKEIRDALLRFKESGKFLVAYADNYSQQGYYIASAADKVYLNPMGMLDLHGLASNTMYLKNTLEKIGIEMTIVKHGKYKSAVEPYTTDKMSEASKEQTTQLLDVIWDIYCTEVGASRGLNTEMMNIYADKHTALLKPELLLNYKLIDGLKYYDEMLTELKELSGRIDKKKDRRILTTKYAKSITSPSEVKDKIAIIYAEGAIDGGGNKGINSKKLSSDIRKARLDDDIKAIVLRVNSPGGSAYGSEQIWREVILAKEGKPFIVSMGDLAASGGYYIACAAHSIIAQPNTITGSIGIFGVFPNINKLNDKLGLTFDGVQTNKLSNFLDRNRPVTATEKQMLQVYIDRGYNSFVGRCADGRQMTTEQIDEIAQGRVWTGRDAKEIGLVDQLGNIQDAIALAAEMSGLEEYKIEELPIPKPFIETLMENLQGQVKTGMMKVRYGEAYKLYEYAERIKGMQGTQARMAFDVEIY